jgi:undecaprenyl-diphosphatase
MDVVQAIILGIVQGIAEWLPVSSEAVITLVMTRVYGSGVTESVNTAIWLHTGTMVAALVYFRHRFTALLRVAYDQAATGTMPTQRTDNGRLLLFLVIATAITAVVGGGLYFIGIETIADYPDMFSGVMAAALFLTGLLRRYTTAAERTMGAVNHTDSALVGVLQGLAVVPGISRSGSTVFGLLYRDFTTEDAFVLSFLLSVPAVFIANIGINLFTGFALSPPLLVAALTAFVAGYAAIDVVLAIADRAGIAYVCFALAAISLLPVIV